MGFARISPVSPAAHTDTTSFVAPDRLFSTLDGRDLTVRGKRWHVEIYSVCDRAGSRWVQLALGGEALHMLTVQMAAGTGVGTLIPALLMWLAHPSGTSFLKA